MIRFCWPGADAEEFHRIWRELDFAKPYPLFPGVREAIQIFANKKYTLAVHTSRSSHTTLRQLSHNGVDDFFAIVQPLDDSPAPKPDPRSVEPIMKKFSDMHLGEAETLYVGDTVDFDWEMSRRAGIDFIGVTTGMNTKEEFIRAGLAEDRVIPSVAQLPALLGE